MTEDLETRLRSAASQWHDAAAVSPPPVSAPGHQRSPRRWLAAGAAGLAAASAVAVVVIARDARVQPTAASTQTPTAFSTAFSTALATESPTASDGTPTAGPPPFGTGNACSQAAVAYVQGDYRLAPTDTVAELHVCGSPTVGVYVVRDAVRLVPLVAALRLPDVPRGPKCSSPIRVEPPVLATLTNGVAFLHLPTDHCGVRAELADAIDAITAVRTATPTAPPSASPTRAAGSDSTTCTEIRDSLSVPTAWIPDGAQLTDDESADVDATTSTDQDFRRLSYTWGGARITVTAGCDLTTMPRPSKTKLVGWMPDEEWYWQGGVASWEGDARPDTVVWAVPGTDAWIEVQATAADGGRAMGGDEFPELARHIRYAGRAAASPK